MLYGGHAGLEGTATYRDAFESKVAPGHFRELNGLWASSIGIGTYLGDADEETDAAYRESMVEAVRRGCNVIDTAINYRFQRSERSVGAALAELFGSGEFTRDQIVLSTKGGFIPFDGQPPESREEYVSYLRTTYLDPGLCTPEDIAADCHCMTPAYLRHELDCSLANLGIESVDVYYVHNPETQLQKVSRRVFRERLAAAFAELERAADEGKICCYGTATWNGYRADPGEREFLSLGEVLEAAEEAGGKGHRFRVVQLPLNLGMPEAFTRPNQMTGGERVSFLSAAARRGIAVMTSGSLLQGQVTRGLPHAVAEAFPGFETDAQRALQFTRSAPGVAVALVGMRQKAHVEENLAVSARAPATFEEFMRLFRRT